MKGFSDKIILIPAKYTEFKRLNPKSQKSIIDLYKNIPNMFKTLFYMDTYVCTTTEISQMKEFNYKRISSISQKDINLFKQMGFNGFDTEFNPYDGYEYLRKEVDLLKPLEFDKNTNNKDKQNIICMREKILVEKIISSFNVILNFSNYRYRIMPKLKDNKIFIMVDVNTLNCTTYLSGIEAEPSKILNIRFAKYPLDKWNL